MTPTPSSKAEKKKKPWLVFNTPADWDVRYNEIRRDGIKTGKKDILDELIEVFRNNDYKITGLLNIIRKSL